MNALKMGYDKVRFCPMNFGWNWRNCYKNIQKVYLYRVPSIPIAKKAFGRYHYGELT